MTVKGHSFGPNIDSRFTLHQLQPRANKLGAQQRVLCKSDHAFAEALQKRVANPVRWQAFLDAAPDYQGRACPECGSTRRRTRDRSCYACELRASAGNFDRIRSGVVPIARQSRAGYLDNLERRKRERSGEVAEFKAGSWTAKQYPTGRLAVTCSAAVVQGPGTHGEALRPLPSSPYLGVPPFGTKPITLPFECLDLNSVPPELVHGLAARNQEFMDLLRWASWA